MNILHVSKIIGIAGSENYLLKTLPKLNESLEVHFLALVPKNLKGSEQEFIRRLEDDNVKTHIVYYGKNLLSTAKQIKKIAVNNNIQIAHSHLIHADFMMALVKKYFLPSIQLVSTKHGYEEYYNATFGFDPAFKVKNKYWRIARWAEKQVTKSYTISRGLYNLYVGLDICKAENTDLIYYGFDFDPIPMNEDLVEDENQLVMVGRLTKFKGHTFAIKAMQKLKEKKVPCKLLIIGSGPLENELKQQVNDLQLNEEIRFLGYRPNGAAYMRASKVVLIPSIAEGFGVVVLEAMAAETPIACFNVPSLNEHMQHEITGMISPPYDEDDFSENIKCLLQDGSLRTTITKNASEKLHSFYCMDRMITETLTFYNSL